eukprot:gene21164-41137_t
MPNIPMTLPMTPSKSLTTSLPLWQLSAQDLAARIARREVTATQVTQSVLDRIDAVNPTYKALPEVLHAQALAAAKKRGPLTAEEQRQDDANVLRESLSDLFEVDHYMEEDPALNYAAPGVGPDVVKKMRKGYWPVQD